MTNKPAKQIPFILSADGQRAAKSIVKFLKQASARRERQSAKLELRNLIS